MEPRHPLETDSGLRCSASSSLAVRTENYRIINNKFSFPRHAVHNLAHDIIRYVLLYSFKSMKALRALICTPMNKIVLSTIRYAYTHKQEAYYQPIK